MDHDDQEDDDDSHDDNHGNNNCNDLNHHQATLAAYARRKFSSGEISTEHMRNIMKVGFLIMLVVNGDAILYTKTKEYHEGWKIPNSASDAT